MSAYPHGQCAMFSAAGDVTEPGRAPSPGPDFKGMSPEEIRRHRSRAGDRWTPAEASHDAIATIFLSRLLTGVQSAKIQELRGEPRCMPWKQISKIIGKTPLACRLRMNQIRKADRIKKGELPQPRAKRGSKSPKSKAKQVKKSSSPQPQRILVPAEAQRPLPAFEPVSSFVHMLPPLQSQDDPMYSNNQGHFASHGWHGVAYQPPPQQPHRALDVLATHAANQVRLSGPEVSHYASPQDFEASAEIVSPQPQRKHSTIHGLLNPVADEERA
ncbi:hypothetical protein DOTSEDRAFT_33289 [Dothistroma septosporum NZE10]|uniref:Myb-like domain-containing protein n=1 Tax=Dothistroma septosporum (strain NZE10 / CBS 128990) TaxID=675120 RepID=N1PTM5_DOTSN|nr:hypothetical protein DOTSEDRAFT_33289 [Dothistroma septosporum NZE10]